MTRASHNLFALLFLCACGSSVATRPAANPQPAAESGLAHSLEVLRMELGLPGAAVLRIEDGAIRDAAFVGFRSKPSRKPLTPGDRFHLGSDGKAMTATLAAVLIERGELPGWDASLSEVFAGETIDPGLRDVTLAELAAHRAGLPRDPEVTDEERSAILAITDPVEQRRFLVVRELGRPPAGTRGDFLYSNVGFMLLGAAIERALGIPYELAMRERLFAPLRLDSCGFEVPAGDGGYGHRPDGALAGPETAIPPAYAPVGGVHCTMHDWARFVLEHLRGERGGSKLLGPGAFLRLHTPVDGATYAYGWNIRKGPRGRLLSHAGSNGYWMAIVRAELDTGGAVLFATNVGEMDPDALEVRVEALGGARGTP